MCDDRFEGNNGHGIKFITFHNKIKADNKHEIMRVFIYVNTKFTYEQTQATILKQNLSRHIFLN